RTHWYTVRFDLFTRFAASSTLTQFSLTFLPLEHLNPIREFLLTEFIPTRTIHLDLIPLEPWRPVHERQLLAPAAPHHIDLVRLVFHRPPVHGGLHLPPQIQTQGSSELVARRFLDARPLVQLLQDALNFQVREFRFRYPHMPMPGRV